MSAVMDILLTSEDCYEAEKVGTLAWSTAKAEPKELRAYINRELCRAQVRKVAEWAQGMNCAAAQANDMVASKAYEDLWQTLREAAGEGR